MYTDQPNQPIESFRSLSDIRLRKEVLLSEIQHDDKRIKTLWTDLFHAPKDMVSSTPSKRFSGFMNTGAGLLDGIILGWKLYQKFKKK
ncbi:hypothetical protein HMPREF3034_00644 [Prevotella sp. DNF00663]|uniref:hypothetical protein n=1 Tax=Prevotella sp. DNF00663 TaxID=1384078 RepID=UPI00078439DF|nr:hypothetical protein [Prevotella sp. DNF00663]KXB84726.1 hypothetical protein HMPREF3034_00644 [Prevotella sp. DNF00663]